MMEVTGTCLLAFFTQQWAERERVPGVFRHSLRNARRHFCRVARRPRRVQRPAQVQRLGNRPHLWTRGAAGRGTREHKSFWPLWQPPRSSFCRSPPSSPLPFVRASPPSGFTEARPSPMESHQSPCDELQSHQKCKLIYARLCLTANKRKPNRGLNCQD